MLENSLNKFRPINYILGLLILLAALLLARNIISLTFSSGEISVGKIEDKPSINLTKKNMMHYAIILEKNPFGKPMKLQPLAVQEKTEEEAPVYNTLSDLHLVGTVVGPKKFSYAIFEDKSPSSTGGQDVFTYDEKVFNYGVLTKIDRTAVDIERDSASYRITFPPDDTGSKNAERPVDRQTARQESSFARKVGEQEYVLDSRRVQKSLENPEQILTDARLLPNFVDGRQEGFRISEVVPDGLYGSLGLENGDILLKVNGLEISNPEVAMQAMTALRGMNRVNLDIIRNGKNMSMNYQIR